MGQGLERNTTEPRKRSAAQELDAELDAGRVKKVKKWREEEERWTDKNPFQLAQNHRNKGESLESKPEFHRRYSDSFSFQRRHSGHGANHQRRSEGGYKHLS